MNQSVTLADADTDRPMSLNRLWEKQAARRPDADAIISAGRLPLTFEGLRLYVDETVVRLRSLGIVRGDRVAVSLANGPEMATAFLAVASAATCAPLNPAYTVHEVEFYLSDLDAKAVIVESGIDSPVRAVAAALGLSVIELSPRLEDAAGCFRLEGNGTPSVDNRLATASDVALVLHTSGTTSRPKIIPLTHDNLCTSAFNVASSLQLADDDRCLNVMPLFHIHGLIGALLSSMAAGATMICTPGFSSAHFFQWLREYRPTWYSAVPAMHQEVLARAAAHRDAIAACPLRFIRSSSAALPPQVKANLEVTFAVPVIEAYGMTEAAHQIASNPLPPQVRKPGSVGLPAGPEVAILDAEGRFVPAHGVGEIAIRGNNVSAFAVACSNGSQSSDGWFRTGDTGFIDEDGYVFIAGRVKELINRGGEKISPREIDEVLLDHPAVAQAVACAVPDERVGEDVVAVIVRQPGATVSERELRAFASTRLAGFKVPRRVMFVDQIPTGPTGKIQRIGLAQRLGIDSCSFAQPQGADVAAPRTGTEKMLAGIWAEVLQLDRIGISDNFFELGGDSLSSVEVVMRVEQQLGKTIDLRQLAFGTLQQVAAGCEGAVAEPLDHSAWTTRIADWTLGWHWRRVNSSTSGHR